MNSNLNKHKGFGSFFSKVNHDSEVFNNSHNGFKPINSRLFYTGRHALKYIIETIIATNKVATIWIPEYYCQHVSSWLKICYNNIKDYKVDPLNKSDIMMIDDFASENDIVLINNFWGISDCNVRNDKTKIFLIEDHSHGWLSKACVESTADYCFASLRKSLPVPLAGIAWKPNGEKLKDIKLEESQYFEEIWKNTQLAMTKKLEFEEKPNADNNSKTIFLNLVYNSENRMHNNHELVKINSKHEQLIQLYLANNYLQFKAHNFNIIKSFLEDSDYFNIVDTDSVPFGLTLHFSDADQLNRFKNHLISKNIYPSLLWPENKPHYGYFLNIHIDYRYSNWDIKFMAEVINSYKNN